jgi:hypothetical protein
MTLAIRPVALAVILLAADGMAGAQEIYQRPGGEPPPAPPPAPVGDATADHLLQDMPIPDRNRIIDALGVPDNPLNPYQQSTLKGDRPVFDDWFVTLGAVSDSLYEPRAVPVPQNMLYGDGNDSFGRPRQTFVSQTLLASLSLSEGDTTFKPPDFLIKVTPAANFTHLQVEEPGLVSVDPTQGNVRNRGFVALQEGFIDYHLRDVSDRYDFDALRVGIQPFNADFRGFLFQDQQLGVRFSGTRDNNRIQYNVAGFRRIEKDTNSGLNDLGQPLRRDDIVLANLYVQDLAHEGLTSEFSVVENWNREGDYYYDRNGFLVRPVQFGLENPHVYDVTYLGQSNDGHIGWLNLTSEVYAALGHDSQNELSGNKARIRAYFAAFEPSVDVDWIRLRGSFLWASGDRQPGGRTETGFDAINENPQFAGADTSYWIRQAIPLIGGGTLLVGQNSILPSLRASKDEGQSNFINPGIMLLGAGADFDLLPELRFSVNLNHYRFDNTAVLEILRQQGGIDRDIGWDLSGAVNIRPFDTQNFVLRASVAVLRPGDGFRALYATLPDGALLYSGLVNLIMTY